MSIRHTIGATVGALVLALAAVPAASAHVTVSADNPTAGGYAVLNVKLGHGCDGNATTKLEVKLPEGVTSFTPGRSPFWTGKVTMRTLDEPLEGGHGEKIEEVPESVTFTATEPLPDGVFDSIASSIKLPETEGVVYFPVVQTCEKNTSTEWTQIPEEGGEEPETPAASLTLAAASGDGHGGGDDSKQEDEGDESSSGSGGDEDHDGMDALESDVDTARTLGLAGLVVGALGLLFGLAGMRRRK